MFLLCWCRDDINSDEGHVLPSLFQLLQAREISYEEAIHNATNADEFKMRVSGIFSTDQTTMENSTATNFSAPQQEEFERIVRR